MKPIVIIFFTKLFEALYTGTTTFSKQPFSNFPYTVAQLHSISEYCRILNTRHQGRIQVFKLGGGGVLKKIAPCEKCAGFR
jgi:hypothetical protein